MERLFRFRHKYCQALIPVGFLAWKITADLLELQLANFSENVFTCFGLVEKNGLATIVNVNNPEDKPELTKQFTGKQEELAIQWNQLPCHRGEGITIMSPSTGGHQNSTFYSIGVLQWKETLLLSIFSGA